MTILFALLTELRIATIPTTILKIFYLRVTSNLQIYESKRFSGIFTLSSISGGAILCK